MRRPSLLLLLLLPLHAAHADEDPGAALLASGAVFVEASVDPGEGAVVGQRVSLLLDLGTTNWFTGAPTLPDPEIEGAVVRRFGNQAVNASENRKGETYAVQTWSWWIYPRRTGTFELSALEVVLRTVDDEREKVEVRARTRPLRFEVTRPPEAGDADVLATRDFTLDQSLDPAPEDLQVGDALRRTLTMRADDVPGMLISPVTLDTPDGLRPYPDAPRVEDEYDRGTLTGLRVESTSYVLERAGTYELPEIRVRWWNLDSSSWAEAVADAVRFTVAPNPDAVLGDAARGDTEAAGRAEPRVSPGRIAILLGGLLLLGLAVVFVARRLPTWKETLSEARRRRRASERATFERFEETCRTNDAQRTSRALRAWLDRAAGPDVTLERFVARFGDEALAREARGLGATVYGADAPAPWDGARLSAAVAHARERMQSGDRPAPAARRPLNPRDGLTSRRPVPGRVAGPRGAGMQPAVLVTLALCFLAPDAWAGEAPVPCAQDVRRVCERLAAPTGGSFWSQFRDPQDGAFDTSAWLASKTGFLPVPIIITEPAVGLGGGVALAFFHGTNKGPDGKAKTGPTGKPVPPSVSIVGGLGTENGTWGVFGGHLGVWNDDRIRYTGGAGYVSVNLDYYGMVSEILGKPLSFNIEGFALVQDLQFRIKDTPLFLGARYTYFQNTVAFEKLLPIPGVEPPDIDSAIGGLGGVATWDSRDNFFTPNTGVKAQATLTFWDPAFGSDHTYRTVDLYGLGWCQISRTVNLGLRLDAQLADGDMPFWAQPFINLRGVPAMRYQGNEVFVAETEVRWDFTRRWSLVGFGGLGRATRSLEDLPKFVEEKGEAQNAWNAGGGVRYLLARAMGLRVGLDIARGPEDWAFYITIGSGWLRL